MSVMPRRLQNALARFGPERAGVIIVVLGLLPIAIDGFTQLWTPYESNNATRILTGIPGGFVGGLLVGAMLVSIRQVGLDIQAMRARMASMDARGP